MISLNHCVAFLNSVNTGTCNRKHVVVGLQDATLTEKLQLDPDFSLKKAITIIQQSETVKKQQKTVRGENPSIDEVKKLHKQRNLCPSLKLLKMTSAPEVGSHYPTLGSTILKK